MSLEDDVTEMWMESKGSVASRMWGLLQAYGFEERIAQSMLTLAGADSKTLDWDDADELFVRISSRMRITPMEKLNKSLIDAIETQEKLMNSSQNDGLRSKIAGEIIDRVMGKPTQTLLTSNFNITADAADLGKMTSNLDSTLKRIEKLEAARKLLAPIEV